MAEHGSVPRADFLSWTRAGESWIDFEWATQELYYRLFSVGGWTALWLLKAAIFASLLFLFLAVLAEWGLGPVWMGMALLPLTLALIPSLDVRPDNLTLLFGMLQLLLLERFRRLDPEAQSRQAVRFGAIQFALYAVWTNFHSGFVMGLLLGGIYIAGEAAQRALPRVYDPKAPLDLSPIKPWLGIGLASALGTLLNPFGPRIYSVAFGHYAQIQMLAAHIEEWQEPSLFHVSLLPFWVLLVFSFVVFAVHYIRTRRTPLAHVLALLVFGLSASSYTRNTPFFSLWVFPLALLALSELPEPPGWASRGPWLLGAGFAAVTLAGYLELHPPGTFEKIHDDMHEPTAACRFLDAEAPTLAPLHLYNPWEWGGYVGWDLYPRYRVFMDGRYLFHDYLPQVADAQQDPDAWNAFLDKQGVEVVLFHNRQQWIPDPNESSSVPIWRPMDRWFFPDTRWAMVYWDRKAVILVRRDKVPAAWLKRHEYKVLFPKDQQWIRLQVLRGKFKMSDVEAEAHRYLTEIGDRDNSARLLKWLEDLRRDLKRG